MAKGTKPGYIIVQGEITNEGVITLSRPGKPPMRGPGKPREPHWHKRMGLTEGFVHSVKWLRQNIDQSTPPSWMGQATWVVPANYPKNGNGYAVVTDKALPFDEFVRLLGWTEK